MPEKKVAVINVSKALMGVSFATLAAIGSVSGSMLIAGLTAVPAAVLAVEPILAKLKARKEELLELPMPPWWTSDTTTWNNLCTEIGDHLPHILRGMAARLQKEQGIITTQVVRQIFIDIVADEHLVWEFDPQQRRNVAAEIATPILQKVAEVLKSVIEPIREDTALTDVHSTATNTEKIVEALERVILLLQNIQKQDGPSLPNNKSAVFGDDSMEAQQASVSSQPILSIADRLQQKIERDAYDVFICYNSVDRPEAMEIGKRLKDEGILSWLDNWRPGTPIEVQQREQIAKIRSAVVLVGKNGIATFQQMQAMRSYASLCCAVFLLSPYFLRIHHKNHYQSFLMGLAGLIFVKKNLIRWDN